MSHALPQTTEDAQSAPVAHRIGVAHLSAILLPPAPSHTLAWTVHSLLVSAFRPAQAELDALQCWGFYSRGGRRGWTA